MRDPVDREQKLVYKYTKPEAPVVAKKPSFDPSKLNLSQLADVINVCK